MDTRRFPTTATVPFGLVLGLLCGCEGETGPQPTSASADAVAVIEVSVQPNVAGVNIKTTRKFTATVTNDPNHAGVVWKVTGRFGCPGAGCGTVSPSRSASGAAVTYTAPGRVPNPAEVHLIASSIADTTRSAFATIFVTIPGIISVGVVPSDVFRFGSRRNPVPTYRLNFAGYVFNDPSKAGVNWSAQKGSIGPTHTASGQAAFYTITSYSAIDTVKARSVANPTKVGKGVVRVASSCPLVYSWDGRNWRLDSGTFGGGIVRALEKSDIDNLDFATPQNGVLRLRLTDELAETDYVDELTVLAVDHDATMAVAPDGAGKLYSLGPLTSPESARDFRGNDVLDLVRAADGRDWESSPAVRDTTRAADLRDGIELSFPKPAGARTARLVVDANNSPWAAALMLAYVSAHGRETPAWYDSLDAAPERTRHVFATLLGEASLRVSVAARGRWEPQGAVGEAGPEIAKRQVVPLDLSRVRGNTVRIRLESVPNFWLVDHVALDVSAPRPLRVTSLAATTALDGRGQEVRAPLARVDGRFFTMEPGDFAEVHYQVPPLPAGRARTFVLRSTGYYRIHSPESGEPDRALSGRVVTEPSAIARISITRMNRTLLVMQGPKR
jgi:hypothetical protein